MSKIINLAWSKIACLHSVVKFYALLWQKIATLSILVSFVLISKGALYIFIKWMQVVAENIFKAVGILLFGIW